MNKCGKDWVQPPECCEYDSNGVYRKRPEEIRHNDAVALPRDFHQARQTRKVIAQQQNRSTLTRYVGCSQMPTFRY